MIRTTENNFRAELAAVLKKYGATLSIDDGGGAIAGTICFDIENASTDNLLSAVSYGGEIRSADVLGNVDE